MTMRCLISILFLALFITKGSCWGLCTLNDITVGTIRTGREIQGKPEWKVVVVNDCVCAQSDIELNCRGFQTAGNVSPSVFSKHGDVCLVNNGTLLKSGATFTFFYAWDPPFFMFPSSANIGPC